MSTLNLPSTYQAPAFARVRERVPFAGYVTLTAALISLAATTVVFALGEVTLYSDGLSHAQIARRVLDSPTPGFGQLGGVWPPLPHILAIPFVAVDWLYYNGLAGTIVSMAAFVVAVSLLYKTVFHLTGSVLAATAGVAVFVLNPNVLYMQATPMTELPLFAALIGMVYGVQRWIQTDRTGYLLGGGAAAIAGALTRYEAWVLLAALTAVVIYAAWRKRRGYVFVEGTVLAFLIVGATGIVAWLTWNLLIFGNPLNFQNGAYAKPSLWVNADEHSIGDVPRSAMTYFYATLSDIMITGVVLGLAGLIAMAVRLRLASHVLPALSILVMAPFFTMALAAGQRPLHVHQFGQEDYNVRFGLLMIIPAAIGCGYLVFLITERWRPQAAVAMIAVAIAGLLVTVNGGAVVTRNEPLAALQAPAVGQANSASAFLGANYSGGKILMQSFGNERVLLTARVSTRENVYEGSYQQWYPALRDPAGHDVEWIVTRAFLADDTWQSLEGEPALTQNYTRVFSNSYYNIYRRNAPGLVEVPSLAIPSEVVVRDGRTVSSTGGN